MTISRDAAARLGVNVQQRFQCNVTLTGRDKRGRFIFRRKAKNLVTLTGRNLVVEMLGGTANAAPTHMALGTGSVAVTDADAALGTEAYRDLITRRRTFSSKIQFQLYLDQAEGNGTTYTEAALINVRNGVSVLFARITFSGISKDSSSSLTVSWDINLASS